MEEIRIKELGEIFTGKTPPTENPQNFGDTYPFITPVDLLDDKYVFETERYVSEIGIKHTTLIPENSICVSCIGYIGKIGITTKESCTNQQINSIIVNDEYDIDYAYYLLSYSVPYFKELAGVNVVPQLNKRDFSKVKLQATKNKPEQTAIATILSKVDEAIAATQNSIKAAEKLKKALMQNLLTGKLKPDGSWRTEDEFYEDEKFGKYPKDWNFSRFKDFAILQRGKDLTDNEVIEGEFPVVKSNGVQIYHNQFFVEPPGVVTGRSGTIGKAFYIEERFWAHNTSLYVKDFKGNFPKYIYYLILRMDFRRYYAGTTVPTLNRNDIHRLKIAIPKTEKEQKEIADKIDDCDKSLESKQTKIQTLQRLKKSLMQNLLTGKLRLPQEFIAQFEEVEETIKS